MDNITHSLVGLAAAKAGLERVSPGATALCVIAANAPDADILALLGGRWTYLHHHRGITHSIVGTLMLALLIPSLFYVVDFTLARLWRTPPRVKFRGLLLASLIVSASHPLMDWTNSYGWRPLLPWSGQWYYGDLVFIVDPWIWLGVGGAAFLLTATRTWQAALWALFASVITAAILLSPLRSAGLLDPYIVRALWVAGIFGFIVAHRACIRERWGSNIALVALALVVVYWGALAVIHSHAFASAEVVSNRMAAERGETLNRMAAMPTFASPLNWHCVLDTNRAVYRFDLMLDPTRREAALRNVARFEKPSGAEALMVAHASEDWRAKILLDFARFPVARVEGDCLSQTLVQFADLRYTDPGTSSGTFSLELPVACSSESTETSEK